VAAPNAPNVSVKGRATIGHWEAAHKGVLRDFPPYKLPADALYDCLNVVYRNGQINPRPGMVQLTPGTDLGAQVTGAAQVASLAFGAFETTAFEPTAFQETGNTPGSLLVAATNKKIWAYISSAWKDLTDTPLTAGNAYLAQFTTIQIGSTIFVLITNGVDAPRSWDQQAATVIVIGGLPPLFTDWTTSSDRVIGIVPPYLIQWGNALNISTWPNLNFRVLSDTADALVAIENLGTLGVAVYKKRSIWVGTAQGGLDSSYFTFTLRGQYEGPANPNALVNVNGAHYYMTGTGRVGVFDGVTQTWINDGILPLIQADFDRASMQYAFAVYDPFFREVWFHYPLTSDNTPTTGNMTGLVVVNLPHPFSYEGIFFHSSYKGKTAFTVTAGTDRRLDSNDRVTFGRNLADSLNRAYLWANNSNDDTSMFTGFFQHPPQMTKDGDIAQAEGVETYATYGGGQGPLTLRIGASPMLGDLTTTGFSTGKALDLTTEPTLSPDIDANQRGRFFSLRYDFTSPLAFAYYGSRLMGHKVQ